MKRTFSIIMSIILILCCTVAQADRLPGVPSISSKPQGAAVTASATLSAKTGYYAYVSFNLQVIYLYTGYGPYPVYYSASNSSPGKGKAAHANATAVPAHSGDTVITYSLNQISGYYEN